MVLEQVHGSRIDTIVFDLERVLIDGTLMDNAS